jgi:hypothetical protein
VVDFVPPGPVEVVVDFVVPVLQPMEVKKPTISSIAISFFTGFILSKKGAELGCSRTPIVPGILCRFSSGEKDVISPFRIPSPFFQSSSHR